MVELREVRVFLTLSEQLHFGRTAEHLGLTQSRVSQSLRSLESKLGTRLVERTSRRVSLTDAGIQLRDELADPFESISRVLENTFTRFSDTRSILRVGLYNAGSGGAHFAAIVAAFERQGPCDVEIVELPFNDRVGPLRSGEIDLMAIRLPVDQPEITIGPILSCEPRVLGVARDHPLVGKGQVSIEDLADYAVGRFETLLPPELIEATTPRTTPRGRTIPRRRGAIRSTSELMLNIASGKIVHPTVASFGLHLSHPEIIYLPIIDMPDSESALAWRAGNDSPDVARFAAVAESVGRRKLPGRSETSTRPVLG